MNKNIWNLLIGAVMIVGGLVTYLIYLDIETPVVGLRQIGLVVAVLGLAEVVVTLSLMIRAKRP